MPAPQTAIGVITLTDSPSLILAGKEFSETGQDLQETTKTNPHNGSFQLVLFEALTPGSFWAPTDNESAPQPVIEAYERLREEHAAPAEEAIDVPEVY